MPARRLLAALCLALLQCIAFFEIANSQTDTEIVISITQGWSATPQASAALELAVSMNESATKLDRVLGGIETQVGRYPYMCSLRTQSGGHYCGGALIAPGVVLTAAHCVNFTDPTLNMPTVFVGAFYRTDPRDEHETRSVVRTLIHPDWNPITNYNDIALLYLGAPAMAATLEIAPRGKTLKVDEQAAVLGWGTTTNGGALSQPLETCRDAYQQIGGATSRIIGPGMLCLGLAQGGKDACQGDSGGPALLQGSTAGRDVQVGIISWGQGCGEPGFYGVYTNVSAYHDWIVSNVPALEGSMAKQARNTSMARPPPPRSTSACECTLSGKSGGVQTERIGCAQHLLPFGDTQFFCMTVGGPACGTAIPSNAFPGAAYRSCKPNPNVQEFDGPTVP